MNILALDPATKCGWAHSSGPSGTWDLSIRRDESGGMRLVRFVGKLEEVKANLGIDLVVFEAARHAAPGMQGSLVVQAELQGVLKEWCERQEPKIEYRGYSPTEIKRHATGKGNSSKQLVLERARTIWGNVATEDQADALWLLDLCRIELALPGYKP